MSSKADPFRNGVVESDESGLGGGSATDSDGSGDAAKGCFGCTLAKLMQTAIDVVASIAFWYFLFFMYVPDWASWALLGGLLLTMVLWRVYRSYMLPKQTGEAIPYTCGYVRQGAKEMFLVATVHISPRSPKDVEEVIDRTRPDVAMIELDDERLDRMREPPAADEPPAQPRPEDLQTVTVSRRGHEAMTLLAQRGLWNGEWAGQVLSGSVVFDRDNPYGLKPSPADTFDGGIALVRRGSPNGEFAPFALKAHHAHKSGAEALLVVNNRGGLPLNRIGGSDALGDELKVFAKTGSCGFPPIPVLLVTKEDGEKLLAICGDSEGDDAAEPQAEFRVLPDSYPRRTLRKRLCQAVALLGSGIAILYGIIQCCGVDVGEEFLMAEIAAQARGIPCVCIDVDLNQFWSRLGWAVVPTPRNLFSSLVSWLAFPRVCFQFLYPPRSNIDVAGSMVLHAASFPLKTWVAFALAGFCASTVTRWLLHLFGMAGEAAAEKSGAVAVESQEDRDIMIDYINLLIQMYLLPQIYDAVAASRDEAMYRSVVAKRREQNANRVVVVVGAGHANGILQRARAEGL